MHWVSGLPGVHPVGPNIHTHDQWYSSSHFRGEETKGPSRYSGQCQEPRHIKKLPTCGHVPNLQKMYLQGGRHELDCQHLNLEGTKIQGFQLLLKQVGRA